MHVAGLRSFSAAHITANFDFQDLQRRHVLWLEQYVQYLSRNAERGGGKKLLEYRVLHVLQRNITTALFSRRLQYMGNHLRWERTRTRPKMQLK